MKLPASGGYNKLKFLIWLIMLVLVLTGCGQKTKSDAVQEPEKQGVTDAAGRVVQPPPKVERIACLWAMSGHTVVMLDRGEQIVAVAQGLKRDIILNLLTSSIKTAEAPMAGGSINIETLLKTNPDIIFISQDLYHNENERMKLEQTGIPFVVIGYNSIAQQQQTIELIGEMVGAKEKAVKYNDYYRRCIDLVQNRLREVAHQARPRVYHALVEPLKTDGTPSLSNDWLNTAGAINMSGTEQVKITNGGNDTFISLEQIVAWQPQVIIVNEDGVADAIKQNPQWQAIEAVQNGRVWQMPVGISRWGHPGSLETPLAILWTAKMLYPERFADVDMRVELKGFYREFFGLDVSDEMADQILQGKGRIGKKGQNKEKR